MNLLKINPNKKYLLLPDTLWDGAATQPMRNQAVLISNGLIKKVLPAHLTDQLPGTEVINLPGIFLMPGLVDCHVHFSMNCANLFQAIDDWFNRPTAVMDLARQAATDYLANGVLAVRDGGDKMNIGLMVRNHINKGDFPGPLVTATGQALFRHGKYGDFLGPGVTSFPDALTQIDKFKETGIDQLKVILSGLVSFKEYGLVGAVQFSTTELTEIVKKAHGLGLKVMTHASSVRAVETAIAAGVDSVEHGYFVLRSQLEIMADKNIAWIPTLAPLGNLVASGQIPYPGADGDVIKRSFELQLARVYEAHQLGVNLGIGTDAGANQVWHGCSYHQEIQYYAMAGLANKDIIRMATGISAKIVGQEDKLGSMLPGKAPFLIGLAGNPFDSLTSLKLPCIVIIPELL